MEKIMGNKVRDQYYYSGAIHMHTTESDGTRPFEEVVKIGQKSGLDFMMITDHMTLIDRERGKEGLYDKTLVLIGYEHNDLFDTHHYLVFDSPRVYPSDMTVKEYVAQSARDKAIGILAHPDEIRNELTDYPPYPWNDWEAEGFTGIELWNQMSEWMEKLTRFNKILMSLSPRKSMTGPTDRILKKWDELNMTQKIVGVAGVDAHAFLVKLGPIKIEIFPYKVHFKSFRSYVIFDRPMSKDFNEAKAQLYQSFRDCRLFFANIRWGDASKFDFYLQNESETAGIGQELTLGEKNRLYVTLPKTATVKIVHNGNKIIETNTDKLNCEIYEPGIYRVEAWKGKRGWIFTNHIRVVST